MDGSEHACDGRLLPSARRWIFHLRQFDQSWQLWSSRPIRLRCSATPPTSVPSVNPVPVPTPSPAPIRELRNENDDPATPNDNNDDASEDTDDARDAFIHEPIMANAGFVLQGTSSFVGTLRLALINNCTTGTNTLWCPIGTTPGGNGIDQSLYASLLEQHHQTVVTGATLKYYWHDDNDDTTIDDAGYAFDWNTVSLQNAHFSLLNDINTASLMASPIRSSTASTTSSTSTAAVKAMMSSLSMRRTCDTHRSSGAAIPMATAMAMLGIDMTQLPITSATSSTPSIIPRDATSPTSTASTTPTDISMPPTTTTNDVTNAASDIEPPQPLAAPLLFALPHHIAAFTSSTRASITTSNNGNGIGHRNIRGFMVPVTSYQWRLSQSLTNIGLRASRPIAAEYAGDVKRSVMADRDYDIPLNYRTGN